ncbi:hypothetical protein [Paracoccus salsus]|uniref:hypothetical protein n=1 Tax=Paracoccus salsus TaxID=2911061 RepID=UPI001F1D2654|nr:hypothetical protein [Paracoccus salsus]MCF3972462.1 hypothetical protein [Paracoccus salsus]
MEFAIETLSAAAMRNRPGLAETLLSAGLAHAPLILLPRVSGRRTLSRRQVFDVVVTVAIGSFLASLSLSVSATLAHSARPGISEVPQAAETEPPRNPGRVS